tara:strand:- start:56 stop:712 length:657 start_codon:yes stop_codon:yes gene_type:complete
MDKKFVKRDCLAIKRGMATTTTRPEEEEEERENEDEKGGAKTSAIINARAEEEEDLFSSSSVGTLLLGKNKAESRETIERWRGTANGGRKSGNPTSEKSFQNGEILYENYADLGFSVEFLRESVDCVHLYNETKTDFVPFRGGGKGGKMPSLPFGIDFEEDTAKDVVGKLGEPTSKGGTGVQIFIVYEMLGIKISFNALDWENAGASIHSMAVWKASD